MKENHLKKIIDKQFKIANIELKYDDVCKNKIPNWYQKFTYTEEQNAKWQKWTAKYIKEKLNLTKDRAYIEACWINLNYGLKIKNGKKKK
jgi:uncharacterized GH25 family protein